MITMFLLLQLLSLIFPNLAFNQRYSNWKCKNCPSELIDQIYGSISLSLRNNNRDIYYSFNMDWIDNILSSESKVMVRYVQFAELDSITERFDAYAKPTAPSDETYQLIYTFFHEGMLSKSSSSNFYNISFQEKVDDFLVRNPCFMPLHEPLLSSNNSQLLANKKHPLHSRLSPYSLLFVRLPYYTLGATCALYQLLTDKQFPATCPPNESDYTVHYVSNAGYGGALITLLEQFIYNYATTPEKVFIVPKGQYDDDSWLWNDKSSCASEVNRKDTWKCNFLPLSGCSLVAYNSQTKKFFKETKYNYLDINNPIKLLVNVSQDKYPEINLRKELGDGHATEGKLQEWFRLRVLAFVQRPNAVFRYMIKSALNNVYLLESKPENPILTKYAKHFKPCIGLHVRNGDVWTDGRGPVGAIVDRSLNGHLYLAKNFSISMGIYNIYLATDNVSLIDIAPTIYPEYKWFMLRRKIPQYTTGKHDIHVHEKSPQIELANIFADIISISKCSALISAFDSSFTRTIFFTMCNSNKAGVCPPADTVIRKEFQGGDLPYAGVFPPPASYHGGLARAADI